MKTPSKLLTSICAAVLTALPAAAAPAKPNILLIVGDDMGYADVGFHGCKDIPTPNLDALAAAGVRCTNGYVSGPYCSPSRAGLLTGRYQQRFGHEFNPGGDGQGLPVSETTLADRLKAAGYVTGLVGKWHLGATPEMHPQQRGFDEFFGFLGGAHSYFQSAGILRGNEPVKELDYTTDAFGREAVAFIERHKAQPWFLYLAFNAVHTPMDATDERLAKFPNIANVQRRKYDAMMLAMDEAIGRVREKLADSGMDKNTLVCFISDNGGPTMKGVTINGSNNSPLRGSKRTTLEGGIRVPFVVAWKDKLRPVVYEQPVIQLDLHTTILAAAGVEVKLEWKLDGVNLLPYLSGDKQGSPHDALYWRFGQQMAIRSGAWKLVRYDTTVDTGTVGTSPSRLYNLATDIGEATDLAATQPDKLKELQAKWDAWNVTLVKPLWGGGKRDSDGAEPGKPGRARRGK
jgi:arylsulfatase A-like enzyme